MVKFFGGIGVGLFLGIGLARTPLRLSATRQRLLAGQ